MSGLPMFSSTNNNNSSRPKPKVHMTSAALPLYIDPAQLPTKRSPWRQLRETPFVRTATLVMPEEVYQQVITSIYEITTSTSGIANYRTGRALLRPRYGRVMLTLTDILTNTDGWWWTNVQFMMMLSEGRPGVDEGRFEIRESKLRMELSKETYEKCGLQGHPLVDGGGGRKHMKARYEVQVDLQGKKKGSRALDRVLWAARNVLDRKGPLCWLVVDGDGCCGGDREAEGEEEGKEEGKERSESYGTTTWIEVEGEARSLRRVRVPDRVFLVGDEEEQQQQQYEEDWYELVEWLDMVTLESDSVKDNGRTDLYISRYQVPAGRADLKTTDLRVIRWAGLLSWTWIIALLIEIVKRSKVAQVEESWLALSVASHRTDAVGQIDGYTVVLQSTTSRAQEQQLEEKSKGFQRSRCFQFVDSTTY